MNIRKAVELYNKLEDPRELPQNIFARANARYVLFGVNEPVENIRTLRLNINLDVGLDNLAFSYLSIGCCLAENGDINRAVVPLEKAAICIEYNHFPKQNRNTHSLYFILIGALAYYASSQYSKAFILLKETENELESPVGKLTGAFLKKDYKRLLSLINRILLDGSYIPGNFEDEQIDAKIQTVLFAKSLSSLMEYIYSGNQEFLIATGNILKDLLELLALENEPSMWWIVRLFRIIVSNFCESSLWSVIPPKLPIEKSDSQHPRMFDMFAEIFGFNDFFQISQPPSPQTIINDFIHGLVFRRKNPVVELFVSQRIALETVLGKTGAVLSLPTSSGKTRIAEIAILQCLLQDETSKILYLAPFRSLAFEIEGTLSQTFSPLGFEVSHLYGGSQFSKLDKTLIQESRILIATPEKAKAILRADPLLPVSIKLAIIDEGHLLDSTRRLVTNELFIEELRFHIQNNNGKIILLSAVLPNSKDISQWITCDENKIVKSNWRPSTQRFGTLEFTGENVNISWKENVPSFNKNFLTPFIPKGKRKSFPSNKRQAVAFTATKLSEIGSVLVFVGLPRSVITYAKDILVAFGEEAELHKWGNYNDWIAFELACHEAYGEDENAQILEFAKYGIICHSANLSAEVRFSIEKLMRNGSPKIIVATSTLAQGVNLGVSSVIIANTKVWDNTAKRQKDLTQKDFWNIAGRAGRAFIDTEGKILFVCDKFIKDEDYFKPTTKFKTYQEYRNYRLWQIRQENRLAKYYFDHSKLEEVTSGLLSKIIQIKKLAESCNINFSHLLELLAENDFTAFTTRTNENRSQEVQDFFDWIDDTLLALDVEFEKYDIESLEPELEITDWFEKHFRQSLAYIQAANRTQITQKDVLNFLKARNDVVKKMAGEPNKWKSLVASGLPLRSIIKIEEMIEEILQIVSYYKNSDKSIEDTIEFLRATEGIILQLPSAHFNFTYSPDDITAVRSLWIAGEPLYEIGKICEDSRHICNKYFGFTIPWALNAIARKLSSIEKTEDASAYEELAVLSELGLPNFLAAKIYLVGIKSRVSAKELSKLIPSQHSQENLVWLMSYLIQNFEELKKQCTPATIKWIDILIKYQSARHQFIDKIPNFQLEGNNEINSTVLYAQKLNEDYYLCSPDYIDKIPIKARAGYPFDKVANNAGIYFEREGDNWEMKSRNPYLYIRQGEA